MNPAPETEQPLEPGGHAEPGYLYDDTIWAKQGYNVMWRGDDDDDAGDGANDDNNSQPGNEEVRAEEPQMEEENIDENDSVDEADW